MSAPMGMKVRRDYRDGEKKLPGVTTVIEETLGWSKHGLMRFAAREAAKAAVSFYEEGGAREAVIWRASAHHTKVSASAADAGTAAHDYAEAFIRDGTPVPRDNEWLEEEEGKARRAAHKLVKWWLAQNFTLFHDELALVDTGRGFGGTIDLLARDAEGGLWLIDIKTGRKTYAEMIIQLGAYTWLLAHNGHHIKGAKILHAFGDDDEPASAHPVDLDALGKGAQAFAALLVVFLARKDFESVLAEPQSGEERVNG